MNNTITKIKVNINKRLVYWMDTNHTQPTHIFESTTQPGAKETQKNTQLNLLS